MVGVASSSATVMETPVTVPIPRSFCAVPVTVTIASGSSFVSSTAVMVAVSRVAVALAGITMVSAPELTVKRSATGVMVTVVGAPEG